MKINGNDPLLFVDMSTLHTSVSSPHRSYQLLVPLGISPSPFLTAPYSFYSSIFHVFPDSGCS